MSDRVRIQTTINGEEREFLCEPRQSLLEVLRDDAAADGHQRGLQQRQLRRLQRNHGRRAGELLPRPGRRSARRRDHHHRRHRAQGRAASAATEVPGTRRAAVRHLHARLHRVGQGAAGSAIRIRPRRKCACGWPATCAAAPATTRLCAQSSTRPTARRWRRCARRRCIATASACNTRSGFLPSIVT